MLTSQEYLTLRAYDILAAQRNSTVHGDVATWAQEYQRFSQLSAPNATVLDLGCGSGRDALLITNHRYIGIDLSMPMLAQAQRLAPHQPFACGDLYRLPLADVSVDSVWAAASLLHIPRFRISGALSEVRRVLKPGGLFMCILAKGTGERVVEGKEPGTSRFFCFWEASDWSNALRDIGFTQIKHHEHDLGGKTWLVSFSVKSAQT